MMKYLVALLMVVSSFESFAQHRRETSRTRVGNSGGNRGGASRPAPSRNHDRPRTTRPSPRPAPRSEPGSVHRRPVPGPGPVRRAPGPVVVRRHPDTPVRRAPRHRRNRTVIIGHRRYNPRPFPGYNAAVSLGNVLVTGINDANYEQVDSCSYVTGEGRIGAIKLRALNDDVNIHSVSVRFEDGSAVALPLLSGHIYARGETVWADLPGAGRCVDSVQIIGSDLDFGRGARVEILGMVRRHH